MHRRDFLRASAAAAAVAIAPATSQTARATTDTETDYQWRADAVRDGEVTIEFDREFLERYQPYLSVSRQTRRNAFTFCGYKVTADAYEFDWACYWLRLAVQEGHYLLASKDSHLGDHEPLYLAIDKTDGEVDRAVYTAWHHMVGEQRQRDLVMQQQRADFPSHPTFRVVDPHHQYSAAESSGGSLFELENWLAKRDRWIDNGFYENTSPDAVEDVETMLTRPTWWADGTRDARLAPLFHRFGFGGARGSDSLRGSRD